MAYYYSSSSTSYNYMYGNMPVVRAQGYQQQQTVPHHQAVQQPVRLAQQPVQQPPQAVQLPQRPVQLPQHIRPAQHPGFPQFSQYHQQFPASPRFPTAAPFRQVQQQQSLAIHQQRLQPQQQQPPLPPQQQQVQLQLLPRQHLQQQQQLSQPQVQPQQPQQQLQQPRGQQQLLQPRALHLLAQQQAQQQRTQSVRVPLYLRNPGPQIPRPLAITLPEKRPAPPEDAAPPEPAADTSTNMPAVVEDHGIRDVWASNMEEELRNISRVVQTHRYIAMDTEFPGVVARPIGEFRSTQEYTYHQMKCNVNLLKIIQIGFTFFNQAGERAEPVSTWQFNFKFCLGDDMYAQESIELLRKSGIQFERHERDGMDPFDFAAELIGAGVVLQPNVFLSFHSGYDFGYFIKMLQNRDLEEDDEEFFAKLRLHCPDIYDVKYLMKSCKDLKGGLQEVSDYLQIKRVGPQHQAGSDSLLTGMAFFKMRELYFENNIEREKYSGHLYGLGPFASSAANVTNGASYGEYDTTDNGATGGAP